MVARTNVCNVNYSLKKSLTYDQALTIAKTLETAEKEAKTLQESSSSVPVHAVRQERCQPAKRVTKKPITRPQKTVGPECYRCGGKHKASECKFRDTECCLCKKKGHIARRHAVANTNPRLELTSSALVRLTKQRLMSILCTTQQGHGTTTTPILVNLSLNGKDISMELDTGAKPSH